MPMAMQDNNRHVRLAANSVEDVTGTVIEKTKVHLNTFKTEMLGELKRELKKNRKNHVEMLRSVVKILGDTNQQMVHVLNCACYT